MFGQDIVQDFSLGNNKAHYLITDALGPYFRDKQNKDMEGTFYSLVYDETTNAAGKKELQIGVRYWSHSFCRVVYRHLETFFIGRATAQVIADKINEAIIHASLPFTNLIILGSDSPNVNKSVNKIINDQMIIERNKGILNIGYCNIHTIHNGFLKGLQELGEDVSELVFSIHRFFNDWPSRWEDFSDIQKKCSLPNHHFLKHCSSRWLTLEPSAKRVLEQWPAILKYFLEFVPKHKQDLMKRPGYNKIVRLLKKSTIKAEIHFIISSAHVFTSVTGFFQKEEPMIHLLYTILSSLLQKIVGRICKSSAIKFLGENLAQDDFFISKNFLDLKDIVLNDEISDALKNVNDKDKSYFLLQVRKHYIAAAKYVIKKSSMSLPLLKSLSFLHPDKRTSLESCQHIVEIARAMPFSIPIDLICDEWKCIQIESEEPKSKEKAIDEYWSQYLKMTNLSGESKFPNISKVIKAALSITHGNADVERGFSASGRTLTWDRASMSERTLNALLTVKSTLKMYDNKPYLINITQELLSLARVAYKSYNSYLQREKEKKDKEKLLLQEEMERKATEEEMKKKLDKKRKLIAEEEEKLKKLKREEELQRQSADKLLKEANQRLKEAIKNQDLNEISIAQTMIEGVSKANNDVNEKRKNVDSLQKNVEKKKSTLISNFFPKKDKPNN